MFKQAWQFGRFAIVGICNTGIDFAVTNLLVVLLEPKTSLGLLLISVTACGIATLNSFFLNRTWTFRHTAQPASRAELIRFGLVAGVSLVVNTSAFLFLARYLPRYLPEPFLQSFGLPHRFLVINLAKLGGVAAAFVVSFLGFRFGVFKTASVQRFRETFRFPEIPAISFRWQAGLAVAAAALVRLLYLSLTTTVYGDAASYAAVARAIAAGRFQEIEPLWNNLYCAWQALFYLGGCSPMAAAILASLIPGILLLLPVVWITRRLYGPGAAWLAAIFCVCHPRLIEYSANGFSESFYLLGFTLGIAGLIHAADARTPGAAAGWGAGFGIYAAVRHEAVLAFVGSLAVFLLMIRRPRDGTSGEEQPRLASRERNRPPAGLALVASIAFVVVTAGWAAGTLATGGSLGIGEKTARLGRHFSEQLEFHEAAREAYGPDGYVYGPESLAIPLAERLQRTLQRLPRNLSFSLERLPGILISPVPLFALLLPVFTGRKSLLRGRKPALLLMFVFPLALYPLILLEPRLLLPIVIPVNIFGAAGLLAFTTYASQESKIPQLLAVLTAGVVVCTLGLAIWRGIDLNEQYQLHQRLAGWLETHVDPSQRLTGCGYGYIATTGFLSGHRTIPRLWTDRPAALQEFADRRKIRWLILYEPFLRLANPELLPALDHDLPGFRNAFQAKDDRGRVALIFERDAASGENDPSRP